MKAMPAIPAVEGHPQWVILAIFVITYLGIAMGRVPGLKLNRVGIVLLGAIAMMIFADVTTGEVISCVNWPTVFCFSVSLSSRRNSACRGSMIRWRTAFPRGSTIPPGFCWC